MSCFIHIHKIKMDIYQQPAEVIFMDTTNGQSMGLWAANENIASLEEQLKSPIDKATREALERLLAIEIEWLRLSQNN
jgi:hypothetical protein